MCRILVVEDDPPVRVFLDRALSAEGYAVRATGELAEAQRLAAGGEFGLVLLDLGLPDGEGFTVLERLRASGDRTPVIVLTCRSPRLAAAACLDGGADDFVAKPFELAELTARIRARLHHRRGEVEPTVLEHGCVRLDLRARRAVTAAGTVDLSAREFSLLETFMRHPDQVLSRWQLLSHVWGYDFDPGTNLVSVYVAALRRKLGDGTIQTVRGGGYRFCAP
jgi:two-component system, OmpR family, copper resistance phosphate regulon response regulator CusR